MVREVVVISVTPGTELATGDTIYQVALGEYVGTSPQVLGRLPPGVRELTSGNKIPTYWLVFWVKADKIPYRIGSKWKLTVEENGALNLVEK